MLRARGRSPGHSPFGGQSLRAALSRAASVRSIVDASENRDPLVRALVDAGVVSSGESQSLSDNQVRALAEDAINSGVIGLTPIERTLRPICDIEKVEPAEAIAEGLPEEEIEATHTLEIELVDEDEEPVANEPYRVELPDGTVVQGRLNKQGLAMLTGIKSGGNCKVTFPRLDESVWAPG